MSGRFFARSAFALTAEAAELGLTIVIGMRTNTPARPPGRGYELHPWAYAPHGECGERYRVYAQPLAAVSPSWLRGLLRGLESELGRIALELERVWHDPTQHPFGRRLLAQAAQLQPGVAALRHHIESVEQEVETMSEQLKALGFVPWLDDEAQQWASMDGAPYGSLGWSTDDREGFKRALYRLAAVLSPGDDADEQLNREESIRVFSSLREAEGFHS